MLFSGLPIVEMGTIAEFYADALDIEIIGVNFWVTHYRVMRPPGEFELVKVPIVRIGRSIASYSANFALYEKIRRAIH